MFINFKNIVVIFSAFTWLSCSNRQAEVFRNTLGCYKLDLMRTELGPYAKDSNNYKNLKLVFKSDSTFNMNMQVPFILDSVGKWYPSEGGLDNWSWLTYSGRGGIPSPNNGNQFTEVFKDGADSILYFNGFSYKKGFKGIQEIFFKKVQCF